MARRKGSADRDKQSESKSYVWVKDAHGEEYLCPKDALKNPEEAKERELESCIDVEPLKQYMEE